MVHVEVQSRYTRCGLCALDKGSKIAKDAPSTLECSALEAGNTFRTKPKTLLFRLDLDWVFFCLDFAGEFLWKRLASPHSAPGEGVSGSHDQDKNNSRALVRMIGWVFKLLAHLGHKHPDFFRGPRRRCTKLGEQPHAPALHTR